MNRATPEHEAESSLLGHLIELRSRLMRGLAGVFVILLGLLPFTSKLYNWIAEPLIARGRRCRSASNGSCPVPHRPVWPTSPGPPRSRRSPF